MFDQSCHVAHRHDQNHNQYNHLNCQHHDDEHNNEDDEDDRTASTAKAPNDEPCFVVWAQVFFKTFILTLLMTIYRPFTVHYN